MSASLPLALLALGGLANESTLDVGVRTEARAGLVRPIAGVAPIPTGDLRIAPAAAATTSWRGLRLHAGYNPELWLRATRFGAAPLVLHGGAAGLSAGEGRGPIFELDFSGVAGDVDFMMAGQQLGQPFGAADESGVVSVAAGGLVARVLHNPTDAFDYGVQAELGGLGMPTVYRRDAPPLQLLPRGETFAGLAVGRFDRLRLSLAAHGAWPFLIAPIARTPRLHPSYVGVQPELLWAHRWSRTLNTSVRAGALFAYQRLGLIFEERTPAVIPSLLLSMSDQRRMLRWAGVTTSLNVGVMPLYDPFLLGLTERGVLQLANRVDLGRKWRFDGSVQYLSLLNTVIPTRSRGAEIDDHISMITAALRRTLAPGVWVEGGTFSAVRVNLRPRGGPDIAPQVTFYVALNAGYGWRS